MIGLRVDVDRAAYGKQPLSQLSLVELDEVVLLIDEHKQLHKPAQWLVPLLFVQVLLGLRVLLDVLLLLDLLFEVLVHACD